MAVLPFSAKFQPLARDSQNRHVQHLKWRSTMLENTPSEFDNRLLSNGPLFQWLGVQWQGSNHGQLAGADVGGAIPVLVLPGVVAGQSMKLVDGHFKMLSSHGVWESLPEARRRASLFSGEARARARAGSRSRRGCYRL
jgi:hypothetical protein